MQLPKDKIDSLRNSVLTNVKRNMSAAIAVYLDPSFNEGSVKFFVHNDKIRFFDTNGSFDHSVTITNKTIAKVVSELSEANMPIKFNALVETVPLVMSDYRVVGNDSVGNEYLYSNYTDRTPDNGLILRVRSHSVHYLEQSRIRLLPPYFATSKDPWYARIQTGTITVPKDGILYTYSVPEYDKQTWSLEYKKPYISVRGELARVISDKVIRVSKSPILWNKNNILIEVDNLAFPSANIEDVDRWNGLIYLNKSIPTNSSIAVSYTYKEDSLIYKDINLNGSVNQNLSVLGSVILYYLVPWKGTDGTLNEKTVRHIVAPTVADAMQAVPGYRYPIIPLGAIYIRESSSIEDLNIVDTRTLGGGIPIEDTEDIHTKLPESNFYWDNNIWDGISYPGNASIIMSIPEYISDKFDPILLKNLLTQYLAAGIYPLVETRFGDISETLYSKNISLFRNGSFDNSKYWMDIKPRVPSSFTNVSDSDRFTADLSGNVLTLAPGSGITQRYLKTSARSYISYKERISEDDVSYAAWKDIDLFDEKTTDGFLIGNTLRIDAGEQYKQIKDVSIKSIYTCYSNTSGELYKDIISQFHIMKEISDISGRILYTYSNLGSKTQEAIVWDGPSEGQIALLDLWPDAQVTGYLTNLGNAIIDSIYTDSNNVSLPRQYSAASGTYYRDTEWHDWTYHVRYLAKLYDKTNTSTFLDTANTICNSINSINPYEANLFNAIVGADVIYTVPYKYRWTGTVFESSTLTLTYGGMPYGEVNLSQVETDKFLDGARAFSEANKTSQNALRAVIAGESSKKIFAAPTFGGGWSGVWYLNGSSFTGHSYYSFDNLGNFAGHNLNMAMKIFLNVNPLYVPEVTSRLYPAIQNLLGTIEPLMLSAYPYGGYIPYNTTELVSALSAFNYATGVIIDLSDTVIKGSIDDNGDIYEASSFNYYPTYIDRKPAHGILNMLADTMNSNTKSRYLGDLIFRHNQFLYNKSGMYPLSTDSPGGYLDSEFLTLNGTINLYKKWPS